MGFCRAWGLVYVPCGASKLVVGAVRSRWLALGMMVPLVLLALVAAPVTAGTSMYFQNAARTGSVPGAQPPSSGIAWSRGEELETASLPAYANGLLIRSEDFAAVVATDIETGDVVWSTPMEPLFA